MLFCFGSLEDWIVLHPIEDAQACTSDKDFFAGRGRLHDGLLSAGRSLKKPSVSGRQQFFVHPTQKGTDC
jgi:hypothetical protein